MFTQQNLLEYERDGFTVVRGAFPTAVTRAMVQRTNEMISQWDLPKLHANSKPFVTTDQSNRSSDDYFLTSGDKILPLFEDTTSNAHEVNKIGHALHELDPLFRQVTYTTPVVTKALQEMGYVAPTCIQSMLICKSAGVGGEVTAHQDSTFLISQPYSVCGMWVALKRATVENGCMYFVAGSHRNTPIQRLFVRDPNDPQHSTRFEPAGELQYTNLHEAVPCEAEEGDMVVFHGSVVHFSAKNTSNMPRPAYTMHFYETANGATVWHPRNWLQSRFNPWPLYNNNNKGLIVVDLSCDNEDDVARAWDLAMSTHGACIVVGHGIPRAKIESARQAMRDFFALPQHEKDRFASKQGYGSSTGYNALGQESVTSLGDAKKKKDHVESVCFREGETLQEDGAAVLQQAMLEYKEEVDKRLFFPTLRLAGLALGVGSAFEDLHLQRQPYRTLKASHYPPNSTTGELYGAHTDWEGFVYLLPDENDGADDKGNGGLQILHDKTWINASVPAELQDGFIVNCGDFVPMWTNGRWKSPVHRVVSAGNNSKRDRYSIPYFTGPHPETRIKSLVPKLFGEGEEEEENIQAGAWLASKIANARL